MQCDRRRALEIVPILDTHSRHPNAVITLQAPLCTQAKNTGQGVDILLAEPQRIGVIAMFGISVQPCMSRILARLPHPNITYPVDNGRIRDGFPFLAMEYVEGRRIDAWCQRHTVSLRACVALFLKVCMAVQYAHRHRVIHCDIKPANILVTEAGEPKLLDFGIARLLGDEASMCVRTAPIPRALTLAYASPEQILGERLSTAVDVWALGVVLYQLLCGVRPFGGNDDTVASPLRVSNAIVAGRVRPPSRQAGRRDKVPVELDAITLKALRRDPGQRYASVAELTVDLRCWLDSRPIRACYDACPYRCGCSHAATVLEG